MTPAKKEAAPRPHWAETGDLERHYRPIGISSVAAAARYQRADADEERPARERRVLEPRRDDAA